MDYNAILRNSASNLDEKKQAFSYFFTRYEEKFRVSSNCPFIPASATEEDKAVIARFFCQQTGALIFQKLLNGAPLPAKETAETWFESLAKACIRENIPYNEILRNAESPLILKEIAFWFFIAKYKEQALAFIQSKLQKRLEKETENIYSQAENKLLEKINKGDLCRPDSPCEAWFNQIASGYIANAFTAHTALPQINENYAENEDIAPVQTRFIDFDLLKIKFFGVGNKMEREIEARHLLEQLDSYIKQGSETCQKLFSLIRVDEDLFDWWKENKVKKGADLTDPKTLEKVRNNLDATLSKCKKDLKNLLKNYKDVFYNN